MALEEATQELCKKSSFDIEHDSKERGGQICTIQPKGVVAQG